MPTAASVTVDRQSHQPPADAVRRGPWNDSAYWTAESPTPLERPYRFVTTCDPSYVPGLLALLQSMKENAGIPLQFTVIEYEPLGNQSREQLLQIGLPLEFIPCDSLGHFDFDRSRTDTPRMAPNLNKFLVWLLPYRERCCYIDADTLCLNRLDGIHGFPSLSVVINQSAIDTEPDSDPTYRPSGIHPWNAGIFYFEPDPQLFRELQVYAKSYTGQIRYGDQVIHNDFFGAVHPARVHWIEPVWNMSIWALHKHPELYSLERTRLLHYADSAKPWTHAPRKDWMVPLWQLWWPFYGRAMSGNGAGVTA